MRPTVVMLTMYVVIQEHPGTRKRRVTNALRVDGSPLLTKPSIKNIKPNGTRIVSLSIRISLVTTLRSLNQENTI